MHKGNRLLGGAALALALASCGLAPSPSGVEDAHVVDPTVHDAGAELPGAHDPGADEKVEPAFWYTYWVEGVNQWPENRGSAYVGELVNSTPWPAERSKEITVKAVYSISGGFSYSGVEAALGYQRETSHTDTVKQTVPGNSRVRITAYTTGTRFRGWHCRRSWFSSDTECKLFDAYRSEGVGYRLN